MLLSVTFSVKILRDSLLCDTAVLCKGQAILYKKILRSFAVLGMPFELGARDKILPPPPPLSAALSAISRTYFPHNTIYVIDLAYAKIWFLARHVCIVFRVNSQ